MGGVRAVAEPWLWSTWLLLAALAAAAWLWTRRFQSRSQKGPLRVLARLALEPKRTVYVVRIAERIVVIGASEAGLCQLVELSSQEGRAFEEAAAASPENE